MSHTRNNTLVLFDVDGTLTAPRKVVTRDMLQLLSDLRKKVTIGVVGGSDFEKQKEQLGDEILNNFDYVFSENGLRAFKEGKEFHRQSIKAYLGDKNIVRFVNFVLRYIADLDIPVKRGTFVEFRNGMINVSPIGRNCSQEERDAYEVMDLKEGIRQKMVETLQREFADLNLRFSIGGQISFDVFPEGWDKTYCLQHVQELGFSEVHFFGDKTMKGGNDYEIYEHPSTIGHTVTSPDDTTRILKELFNL
jgi:phosphomannomutase